MMLPSNERKARGVRPDVPYLANERVYLRRLAPADIADIGEISFYDGRAADSDEEALTMLRRIEVGFEEVARRRADRPLMRLWLR